MEGFVIGQKEFAGQWYPVTWEGPVTPQLALTDEDVELVAKELGVAPRLLDAFRQVESRGSGFLLSDAPPARPKILFEAHKFSRFTQSVFDETNPQISSRRARRSLYKGGAAEYDRLREAYRLDPKAALFSASWGAFQIMGFNFALTGCHTVEHFVEECFTGERAHLRHVANFLKETKLLEPLRQGNWSAVAHGYNGPKYAQNEYHTKLARAAENSRFA